MVASCVLIRRYHQPGVTQPAPTLVRWTLIMLFSIGAASCGAQRPSAGAAGELGSCRFRPRSSMGKGTARAPSRREACGQTEHATWNI